MTAFNISNIISQLSLVLLVLIPDCENIISQRFCLSLISIDTLLTPEKCLGTSNVKTNLLGFSISKYSPKWSIFSFSFNSKIENLPPTFKTVVIERISLSGLLNSQDFINSGFVQASKTARGSTEKKRERINRLLCSIKWYV